MQRLLLTLLIVLSVAASSLPALAQSNPAYYECNLSGSPTTSCGSGTTLCGCPSNAGGGSGTSLVTISPPTNGICQTANLTGNFCGADSNTVNTVAPISAYGSCYWVFNTDPSGNFVPFGLFSDWEAFINYHPGNIELVPCSDPAGVAGYGSSGPETYQTPVGYPVATAQLTNPPVYGYYEAPTGTLVPASIWPASPSAYYGGTPTTFTSSSGANKVQMWPQWTAIAPVSGQLSWQLIGAFGPAVTLTATDQTTLAFVSSLNDAGLSYPTLTITSGDNVTLNVTATSPYSSSFSYAYSPNTWTSGATVSPTAPTTNYSVAVTDTTNNLTSYATITVAVQAVGVPIVTLTASPTSISAGASSTLTWTVTGNATSCTASGDASFTGSIAVGGGSQSVSPSVTTSYTVTCQNASGTSTPVSQMVTVETNCPGSQAVNWTGSNGEICSAITGPATTASGSDESGMQLVSETGFGPTAGGAAYFTCLSGTLSGTVDTSQINTCACPVGYSWVGYAQGADVPGCCPADSSYAACACVRKGRTWTGSQCVM